MAGWRPGARLMVPEGLEPFPEAPAVAATKPSRSSAECVHHPAPTPMSGSDAAVATDRRQKVIVPAGAAGSASVPTLRIAQDDADELLERDPLALLIGMLFDQHMRHRSSGSGRAPWRPVEPCRLPTMGTVAPVPGGPARRAEVR